MSAKKTPAKKNGAKVAAKKKATKKIAPRKKRPEPGTWEAIQRALAFAEKKNLNWP
ncbi:MAG: hypothetical protein ICV81_13010 [Flavisolibacter sp.]|nr:hypothetical protein [Flavisolibacter sp.]MBD0289367.1 hypothetical protein [Flavisolibacter sp.]MBD0351595.1 hypothetical protein [Flavisolibacter sp.]